MNRKNIAKVLNKKLNDWTSTIDDEKVVKAIKKDALITGGAIVSLINGETPNDYDVYFRTKETTKLVAEYYANIWNEKHEDIKVHILDGDKPDEIKEKLGGEATRVALNRIECFIASKGVAIEDGESAIDDTTEPMCDEDILQATEDSEIKPKYRPRYFSTNAISLSDDIQLIIRFFGEVQDIHQNYDFVHCTCSYDWHDNIVDTPVEALEAIINKELIYTGSKYPLCSIIRTRKFISRGYTINAGQYVKMALQLNDMDLTNKDVFKEQLTGVDSAYFNRMIEVVNSRSEDADFQLTSDYLIELINRFF